MKTINGFWEEMRERWKNAMPRFFKKLMWVCGLISGTALAANEAMQVANIEPHEWWVDIRPYLIAVPAGAMFACKFTQRYDDKGNPVKQQPEDSNRSSAVNFSDVETQQPCADTAKQEIEPYNDD